LIYPANFEQKIGFDQIRQMLKEQCLCQLGRTSVDEIIFSCDFEQISRLIKQTEEFRQVCLFDENFPTSFYFDLTTELSRAAIEGTYIETESLFDLLRSLKTIKSILNFFKKKEEGIYPELREIAAEVLVDNAIIKNAEVILDDKGKIRDSASPELQKIRKDLISKQSSISKKMNTILRHVKKQGWMPEDAELTVRNGRMVIPVLATHKRKFQGFVHDESATGHTVFIEPAEIFETNNEIRELEYAEKREIIKILIDFTDFIRPHLEDLKNAYFFLGNIDFIRAKALFAIKINAVNPAMFNETIIDWNKAFHPLLYLACKQQKKHIEPLNVRLDGKSRILVISGPNAGGKSVCLKTLGLLQYMWQCGLLVPMSAQSEMGIFENIFIDIGDEQSLENDLSTYSSHLLNMKYFLQHASDKTLFLIDEFGSGTEPQLGGAIAESILEKLNENKSFGLITTHYSNLKIFADNNEGVINAAMLFDSGKMEPLFILKTGKPGSSYAFEIAEKTGLPKELLSIASTKAGVKQLNYDKQLQQLEVLKLQLDEKQSSLEAADTLLSETIQKYTLLTEEIENTKKGIIQQATTEARALLDQTNKVIENTIREIKESDADKEKTKLAREKLELHSEKIHSEISETPLIKHEVKQKKKEKAAVSKIEIVNTPIEKGDYVRIIGQSAIGEVMGISEKEVFVVFGSVYVKSELKKLEKINVNQSAEEIKQQKGFYRKIEIDLNEKLTKFKSSIDVRGMRAEEVRNTIQHFIDEAVLLNVPSVSILHGKGNGVLRNVIREYLQTASEVKQFRDEVLERGGHGITLVFFR
jgi:DNA mismatch repair protein MutS2